MALTYAQIERVAQGGVCNSGTAVEIAKLARMALMIGVTGNAWSRQILDGETADSYTAREINALLYVLLNPLDELLGQLFDIPQTETTEESA